MSEIKNNNEAKKEKKDLKVVTGDENDLDISPVFEHLSIAKPKTSSQKPKHIIVPKTKKKDKNK